MALNKSTTLDSGVSASYWKLTSFIVDCFSSVARVSISGYVNQDARESGKVWLSDIQLTIAYDKTLASFSPFQQAYDNIKQLDQWSDATDI